MRNRERFNANVDENQEQKLSTRIKEVRKILKELSNNLKDTIAIIEPCEHMLIWGSLRRCLICMESEIMLISQGYIGSANALLRQMLEFLMWSKLGLSCDEMTLVKINSYFYDESLGKSHPVTNILRNTRIIDFDNEITGDKLTENCKSIYHKYSFVTHATGLAQQNPYKSSYYYDLINKCLSEVCILLDVFLCVFKQYCEKVLIVYHEVAAKKSIDIFSINKDIKEERDFERLWAAATSSGIIVHKISEYHSRLQKTQGDIISELQLAFCSKWIVNGNKI